MYITLILMCLSVITGFENDIQRRTLTETECFITVKKNSKRQRVALFQHHGQRHKERLRLNVSESQTGTEEKSGFAVLQKSLLLESSLSHFRQEIPNE